MPNPPAVGTERRYSWVGKLHSFPSDGQGVGDVIRNFQLDSIFVGADAVFVDWIAVLKRIDGINLNPLYKGVLTHFKVTLIRTRRFFSAL
jgi:hypothetical protein